MANRIRVAPITLLVYAAALVAQTPVTPPKPADVGPSLAVTMQFIQDKLNDIGKVSSTAPWKSNDGGIGNGYLSFEVSKGIADASQCRVSYHRNSNFPPGSVAVPDFGALDKDDGFDLRDVEDIVIKPLEQYLNESRAKKGDCPIVIISTNPAITALVVRRPHGGENMVAFYDAALADRLAKALTHAVELCGGGSKEPF